MSAGPSGSGEAGAGRRLTAGRKCGGRTSAGLGRRLIAIADVADHDIVPDALPGRPAAIFRAGTELGFQMRALWLASWPVRWNWLGSLEKAARLLLPLYRMTLGLGGDRSAMRIALKGVVGGEAVERVWTLVARDGDGPEIPTLAAALLAEDMLAGKSAPGARHGWAELDLARFEPLFAGLAIRHRTVERAAPPLYRRVMGREFDRLPAAVRRIHEVNGDGCAAGEGRVTRGKGRLARLIGRTIGFPPEGAYSLHVAFAEEGGVERWTRHFGPHSFSSRLSERRGLAVERFGPLRFGFALAAEAERPRDEDAPLERVRPAAAAVPGSAHRGAGVAGGGPFPFRRGDRHAAGRRGRPLFGLAGAR